MRFVLLICCLLITGATVLAQQDYGLEASVDNAMPYVGEPVTYTLRLYQRQAADDLRFEPPPFNGFGQSTEEVVTQSTETRAGAVYTVTTQQRLLYPTQAGEYTIAPFVITVPETPFQTGATIRSDAITVQVQSLPEDAPPTFTNAVGQYDVQASLSSSEAITGEPITFSLTVSGTGNLEQITAPDINFPASVQAFKEASQVDMPTLGSGTKVFRWSVVPQQSGTIEIPSLGFSYFNPQTAQYQTRRTAPLALMVTGEAVTPAAAQPITPNATPFPLLDVPAESRWLSQSVPSWFWWMWSVPPALVLLMWLGSAMSSVSVPTLPQRDTALRRAQQRLRKATNQPPKVAYETVRQVLIAYVQAKSTQSVSEKTLETHLQKLPAKAQQYVMRCYEEAASGQYAPISKADAEQLVQRTRQVLQKVDELW